LIICISHASLAHFMPRPESKLFDNPRSFGWMSIVLHWITAIVIIVLWFVGDSIAAQEPDLVDQRRKLHVTIALSFYLILVFRIYWRTRSGHPHVAGQSLFIHRVAQAVHYVLLIALGVMLVTGPLMLWTSNAGHHNVFDMCLAVHQMTGNIIIGLTLIHIAGALKHLMFHHDETIIRMIRPRSVDP
jgi:cytochrome b561